MRTIVHLSDLHFGRVDQALLAPITAQIHALQPDLVVVSGDLTQRARSIQFEQAKAFLDGLPQPQIVVPGNHDIPLHNVAARFCCRCEAIDATSATICNRLSLMMKLRWWASIPPVH